MKFKKLHFVDNSVINKPVAASGDFAIFFDNTLLTVETRTVKPKSIGGVNVGVSPWCVRFIKNSIYCCSKRKKTPC